MPVETASIIFKNAVLRMAVAVEFAALTRYTDLEITDTAVDDADLTRYTDFTANAVDPAWANKDLK